MQLAVFRSHNLLGDGLYTSIALTAFRKYYPGAMIVVKTLPDFITPIYSQFGIQGLSVTTEEDRFSTFNSRMVYRGESVDFYHEFLAGDCGAYIDQQQKQGKEIHMAEAYVEFLQKALGHSLPIPEAAAERIRPTYQPIPVDVLPEHRGCILLSMHSASCSSKQGKVPNKMIPWEKWKPILRYLRTLGLPLRIIGGKKERCPLAISEEEYLLGLPVNDTANVMRHARVVISLDNGMGHLASCVDAPLLLFYPEVLTINYIAPLYNPNLCLVQIDPARVNPAELVAMVRRVMPDLLAKTTVKLIS